MVQSRAAPLFRPTIPEEPDIRGPADYFAYARQNRDNGKASIDLIFLEQDGGSYDA